MKQLIKGFYSRATYFLSTILFGLGCALLTRKIVDPTLTIDTVLILEVFGAAIGLLVNHDIHQRSQNRTDTLKETAKAVLPDTLKGIIP